MKFRIDTDRFIVCGVCTEAEHFGNVTVAKARVGGAITHQQMLDQLALSELSAADQTGVAEFFEKEYALNQIPPPQ